MSTPALSEADKAGIELLTKSLVKKLQFCAPELIDFHVRTIVETAWSRGKESALPLPAPPIGTESPDA